MRSAPHVAVETVTVVSSAGRSPRLPLLKAREQPLERLMEPPARECGASVMPTPTRRICRSCPRDVSLGSHCRCGVTGALREGLAHHTG